MTLWMPVTVDVRHGVDMDAEALEVPPFPLVDAADPHQGDVCGVDLAEAPADARPARAGPVPSRAASGMPWMLPEGEVPGVLMSLCASTQRTPTFC